MLGETDAADGGFEQTAVWRFGWSFDATHSCWFRCLLAVYAYGGGEFSETAGHCPWRRRIFNGAGQLGT